MERLSGACWGMIVKNKERNIQKLYFLLVYWGYYPDICQVASEYEVVKNQDDRSMIGA